MGEKSHITYGGMGFGGALTIVFIVLKLTNVIDWNWFWVLSPAIFSLGLVLLMVIVLIIIMKVKNK